MLKQIQQQDTVFIVGTPGFSGETPMTAQDGAFEETPHYVGIPDVDRKEHRVTLSQTGAEFTFAHGLLPRF